MRLIIVNLKITWNGKMINRKVEQVEFQILPCSKRGLGGSIV